MHLTQRFLAATAACLAAVLLSGLAGCVVSSQESSTAPDSSLTTVLIVRHAEKAAEPADDPPLTDAGRERAAALSRLLGGSGVAAVYATQFLRTQQTVEPLAAELGLEARNREAKDVDGLMAQIFAENRGQTVVVAGHSDTVPMLVEKLTGEAPPPIDETEYHNLYVVAALGPGEGKALRLRYGGISPPSATPAGE
jgi:broad specificity phosphatase PhoE